VTLGSQQQGQSSPKLGVLKLRSNVDSFSSICDVHRSSEHRRSTAFADMNNSTEASDVSTPTCMNANVLKPINESKAKRTANSAVKSQRGSVVLNDKLSRQARPATTHGGESLRRRRFFPELGVAAPVAAFPFSSSDFVLVTALADWEADVTAEESFVSPLAAACSSLQSSGEFVVLIDSCAST